MPATVLTHVYNEELLLPYWLRHHRELFDHGVIVDRGSTDRSLEIIRELVPEWEVVRSRNPLFDARDTDLEMMDRERRYGGWKVVLTVTELLLHDDLRGFLRAFERSSPGAPTIGMPLITMVDAPHERNTALDDRPLYAQRHHHEPRRAGLLRFLHREAHGGYGAGRHAVARPYVLAEELVVLKYTWSPYPQTRGRRLQIASAIPDADVRLGMSWTLFFTADELDEQFAAMSAVAVDLHEDRAVAPTLARLREGYAGGGAEPVPRLHPDPRRRIALVTGGPGASRCGQLFAALSAGHDVRTVAADRAAFAVGWAEIVVADHVACATPGVGRTIHPLVVDLTACAPDDAGHELLLRGDFFLWADVLSDAWIARFAEVGRIRDAGDGDRLPLLGAGVGPHTPVAVLAQRLAGFLSAPRRTTARVAHDTEIAASRIAYARRHKAALDTVLGTVGSLIALTNQNAQLQAENARLRADVARLSG